MPHLLKLLESEEKDSHRAQQRCHGSALGATEGLALASLHMVLQGVREGLNDMPPASQESWQPFKVSDCGGIYAMCDHSIAIRNVSHA